MPERYPRPSDSFWARLASRGASTLARLLPARPYNAAVRLRRLRIPAPAGAPELAGLRIGAVSDVHRSEIVSDDLIRSAAGLLSGLDLDLLALVGDYVSRGDRPARPAWQGVEPFAGVPVSIGRVAVPGNHDIPEDGTPALYGIDELGVSDITNTVRGFTYNGCRVRVAGVDDALRGYPRVEHVREAARDAPTILLSHNPDFLVDGLPADVRPWLALSGHLHAGQIRLGPFRYHPTRYPGLFDHGYLRLGAMHTYVSAGLGVVSLPFRLGAPPEVVLIEVGPPDSTAGPF